MLWDWLAICRWVYVLSYDKSNRLSRVVERSGLATHRKMREEIRTLSSRRAPGMGGTNLKSCW